MRSYRELLLILPVAAILFLLLGATSSGESKKAVCAENLRQIFRAAQLYSADNAGMIVPAYTSPGAGRRIYWASRILPYVKQVRNFYCPADPGGRRGLVTNDLLPEIFNVDYVSYGISYYIASTKQKASPEIPYNINAVADPSYVVYFGDARFLQLRPTKGCWKKDWNPVHPEQGANYVMADGHVEFFTGKNPGLYDKVPGWKQDRKRWKNWKKL